MATSLINIPQIVDKSANQSIITDRVKNIGSFSDLGYCDLVYISWSKASGISWSQQSSKKYTYYYVTGINTISPSSIGAYVNSVLTTQEKSGFFSNGSWKITQIKYCIHDAINNYDAHLSFNYPGILQNSAFNEYGKSIQFDELDWSYFYISSTMRSLYPCSLPAGRHYETFRNKDEINNLLTIMHNSIKAANLQIFEQAKESALNLSLDQKALKTKGFSDKYDLSQRALNLFLGKEKMLLDLLLRFLLATNQTELGIEFFSKLILINKRNSAYLIEILVQIGCKKSAGLLIAGLLHISPHNILLLQKEAQLLIQMNSNETSIPLILTVLQLNPNNLEAWIILIELYIMQKNYISAIFCMNAIQIDAFINNEKALLCSIPSSQEKSEDKKINPKTLNSVSTFSQFYCNPRDPDFNFVHIEDEISYVQSGYKDDSEKVYQNLKKLPANKFNSSMAKLYKVLVKIERAIGWERLIILRAQLFSSTVQVDLHALKKELLEDYQILNPPLNKSQTLSTSIKSKHNFEQNIDHLNDGELSTAQNALDKTVDEKNISMSMKLVDESSEQSMFIAPQSLMYEDTIANEISSENNKLPAFLYQKTQLQNYDLISKSIQQLNKPIIYQIQRWKDGDEADKTDRVLERDRNLLFKPVEGVSSEEIRRMFNFEYLKSIPKRYCSKEFDILFDSLFEDLNCYFSWMKEQRKILGCSPEMGYLKIYYDGIVWVERGRLAERLLREVSAEKAYLVALEQGKSNYSSKKLIKMFSKSENVKGIHDVLAKYYEDLRYFGFNDINHIPQWAYKDIYRLIRNIGYESFKKKVAEIFPRTKMFDEVLHEFAVNNLEPKKIVDTLSTIIKS